MPGLAGQTALAGPAAVTASGAEAIGRTLDTESAPQPANPETPFDEMYQIAETAAKLAKHGSCRVGLQFPDSLLGDSAMVVQRLEDALAAVKATGVELFLLADTTFGSCCVDEVGAQHAGVNVLVHYGPACMTPTRRLPVYHVFGRAAIDADDAVQELSAFLAPEGQRRPDLAETLVIMHDVSLTHAAAAVAAGLATKSIPFKVILSEFVRGEDESDISNDRVTKASSTNRRFTLDDETSDFSICWLGGPSAALVNVLVCHNSRAIVSYDPSSRRVQLETGAANKLLMRRYGLIQAAKDADVVGIVMGTLGAASYMPLVKRLQTLIASAGKRAYVLSVGKMLAVKLGNFLEIECFVFIACPEHVLVDTKAGGFMRPVVTPWELELALERGREWDARQVATGLGSVVHDIDRYLALAPSDLGANSDGEDTPYFSLATGQLKSRSSHVRLAQFPADASSSSGAVVSREAAGAIVLQGSVRGQSAGAAFLQSRSWRGLEAPEETAAATVVEGRSGFARGYENEPSSS